MRINRREKLSPWVRGSSHETRLHLGRNHGGCPGLHHWGRAALPRHEESRRCGKSLAPLRVDHGGVAHPAPSQLHGGIFMMAVAFFSLLFALSWADVSL